MIINKKVWELLEKKNTKIGNRIIGLLDKDRTGIYEDEDTIYLEGYVPNYAYDFLKRFLKREFHKRVF